MSGFYVPGRPIAAKVAARPLGYRRNGRAIWPISGRADIACVAEQWLPATQNQTESTQTATLDKDASGWSSLAAGTVILVELNWRQTSGTTSVTTTGGQTWTEEHDAVDTMVNALYSCVFDGTWTADPVFTTTASASGRIMHATAWSNVDDSSIWDVTPAWTTQSSATSFTVSTWSTNTDGAMAIVGGGSVDDNEWSVNNSFAAVVSDLWRDNEAGADSSLVTASRLMASAGSVGATVLTHTVGGADAGYTWRGALKPAPGGPTEHERAASFDAVADLATVPERELLRAVALDAVADLATVPERELLRAASLDATADISASGTGFSVFDRAVSIDAVATLEVAGQTTKDRAASLEATALLEAAPRRDLLRTASLDATADLSSTGERELLRSVALDATASLDAVGERDLLRSSTFDAEATLEAGHERELLRSVSLDGVADLDVFGEISGVTSRSASFDATAALEVGHERDLFRSVSLDAIADLEVAGSRIVSRSASLDATADVSAAGVRALDRSVSVDADASVEVGHVRELFRSVSLDAEATIEVAAAIEGLVSRSVSFEAIATIEVAGYAFNPTEDWDLPPPTDEWPVSTREGWTGSVGGEWPMPR